MLAHGSQVRKRAEEIQALRQGWIAEVNQANKRNWDFRSRSQLLRPRHLLDGILGDEFVPDEAVYLPRAGCSEIVIKKVSPRQRGVIPDKSFKSRVFPCKNTVAVGSAVVEMSVCIHDCCPAGERGSCHSLGLQHVPGGAGCRRRAGMRLRSQRPRRPARRTAWQPRGASFDHLVGPGEQGRGYFEAERPGGFEVDNQLVFGWRLHRQVGRLFALEDAVDIASCLPVLIDLIRPVGDEAASGGEDWIIVDRGQLVSGRQRDDQIAMNQDQSAARYDQAAIWGTREGRDSALDLACIAYADGAHLHPERRRHGLDGPQLAGAAGYGGVAND